MLNLVQIILCVADQLSLTLLYAQCPIHEPDLLKMWKVTWKDASGTKTWLNLQISNSS